MSYFVTLLSARVFRVSAFLGLALSVSAGAVGQGPTPPSVVPGVPTTPGFMGTVAGNNQPYGYANGNTGAPATTIAFDTVQGVAIDSLGNMYIADSQQDLGTGGAIFQVAVKTGIVSLIAGGGNNAPSNGDSPLNVFFQGTTGISIDTANNIYIVDSADEMIEKVSADFSTISIVAGKYGNKGKAGDGGSATSAQLDNPQGVVVDSIGNVYIADTGNYAIRKVDATNKNITTITGVLGNQCASSPCGDMGVASAAQLAGPIALSLDSAGNIYIMDRDGFNGNAAILSMIYESGDAAACLVELEHPTSFGLSPTAQSCSGATSKPTPGNIYSLVGVSGTCQKSPCGDGLLSINANLYFPMGITVDGAGNIFIADSGDQALREVNAQTGVISTIAGINGEMNNFTGGYSTGNGPVLAATALLNSPEGVALDTKGNLYIADTANYVVEAITAAGTIPLTPQTITFNQSLPSVTYGAAPITLTATADSGLSITYTVTGPATVSGSTLTITGVGTVAVTANQAGNTTYAAATAVTQSFTVDKGTITVAATNIQQPFGTALPSSLPYTITGLAAGNTTTGAPMVTTTYTTTSPIGTSYPITITQGNLAVSPPASATNYNPIVFDDGTLTVGGGGTQTITFPPLPATITYGSGPIPLAATSTAGLPVTYTATGSAIVAGSVGTGWTLSIVSAGPGSVTANQAGNSEYGAATPATLAFTVKQATLTVAATPISQPYGTALPSPLPYAISGLVGSDATGGAPALTTAYTTTSAVGTSFPINVAQGTLAILPPGLTGNYTFNLVPSTLTVTSGANTITFPAIPNTAYGSSVTLAAKASSTLPVSYTVTGPATLNGSTLAITGVGTVAVTATQAGNTNVAAATSVTQTFTATQAVLMVTAFPATRAFGAVNPTFTYEIQGFVNGDANGAAVLTGTPLITTPATPASAPGNYPIVPSVGTLLSTNYTFAFVNGLLTVTGAPSYIVTANPDALMIQNGQSAQTTIQLTPTNNYQGSVALSCGQLPIGLTCTFSPATLNLALVGNNMATGSVLGTLTVNTVGGTPTVSTGALFFIPGGLTGLLLAFNRKRLAKHRKVQGLLLFVMLLAGTMGLEACGGGSPNTAQPGTTSVMITAVGTGTSGTGSPNTTSFINLTVNVTP